MLDSYNELIGNYISKEDFFQYGLDKTIYIPDSKVKEENIKHLERVNNNQVVYMRGHKDSVINQLFYDFYKHVMKNERVKRDPSNSQNPTKIIESLSGYKKSKDLRNYQLSSVFGRSKNILTFCAPWNIVYTPSILDPLLSVDARGELAQEYQKAFREHVYKKFRPFIEEYNERVNNMHFQRAIDEHFERLYDNSMHNKDTVIKFESMLREDLKAIEV